ncbi:MAG: tetratricopeptide 4 [Novosphingobium sp.]|nr:tetratricopeptide 4 [Novosphingobium sp.]
MTWVLVILLALAAFVAMSWALKAPRSGREAIGAALLLGMAGYAAQSHPSLPGSPTTARETVSGNPEALTARQKLAGNPPGTDKWIVIADGMARHGQFADAATVLRGSVAKNPKNGEAWLAMANALVSHADQRLSPAAILAFRRAQDAAPGNPGPPYFFGLALAQSGRLQDARTMWADLLARSPADAPWRADLILRLQELDQFIARQAASQSQGR